MYTMQDKTVADPGAQQASPPPPKIGSTMFFYPFFKIRMLKNKAQIARESIKNEFGFCVRNVRAGT